MGKKRILLALAMATPLGARNIEAQGVAVKVDLVGLSFDASPPFDRPFHLRIPVPDGVDSLHFTYAPVPGGACDAPRTCPEGSSQRITKTAFTRKEVVINLPPLPADVPYDYQFLLFGQPSSAVDTVRVRRAASSSAKHRVHTDVGVAHTSARGLSYYGAASGVHFYFMPVDREMQTDSLTRKELLFKRVSVFAALSVKMHVDKPFEPLLASGAPIVGIGFWPISDQLWPVLRNFRINAGMLFFEQESANPLVSERKSKHAPIVSVTFNTSLQQAFVPIAALLGLK